jgi:lysyl-tRNA synthetase class I
MTATGEGDQFKIFATVIDIAKDFVRQMKPEKFSFYSHKDPDETTSSRPKLYSALIKRFASGLGYDSREKTSNDFVFYMLTRKQPVAESQLEEAFDQPYPWRWGDRSSQRMWTASFADVFVIFSVDGAGEWEISFARNNRQSVTGEGDQFKIFATVIDIAKDFISLMRPKVIQFTAHKEETETTSSRTKLYSAMVNRFANSLGYESKEKPFNDFVVYVLTKKQDESVTEDGKIVPGVNTTVDVKPGETERQAAKFGNKLTKSGPPLLMAETRYTAKEWAILEGGHALEEKIVDHAPRKWFKV